MHNESAQPQVIIRSALEQDLPTLLEFEQGIITAERPFDDQLEASPISYYDLAAYINCENTHVLVADVNSEIAGAGYAQIRNSVDYVKHDKHVYLGFMFVKDKFRGRGINQAIIEELKAWAQLRGVTRAILDVYAGNSGAIRAYEKANFQQKLIKMEADWS
jgi:GNAT superfamily N-acetyltransferase